MIFLTEEVILLYESWLDMLLLEEKEEEEGIPLCESTANT